MLNGVDTASKKSLVVMRMRMLMVTRPCRNQLVMNHDLTPLNTAAYVQSLMRLTVLYRYSHRISPWFKSFSKGNDRMSLC